MRLLVPCAHEEADTRLMVHVLNKAYVWGQTFFHRPVLPSHQTGGGSSSTTHGHHSGQLNRKQSNLVANLFDADPEPHVEDYASA